jgi:hypothetical protein
MAYDVLYASSEIQRCLIRPLEPGKASTDHCVVDQARWLPQSNCEAEAAAEDAAVGRSAGTGEPLGRWLMLSINRIFNGYGYRPAWALGWFALLILIGTVALRLKYRAFGTISNTTLFSFQYTLDSLLPAITLNQQFSQVELHGVLRYFFLFMKVMGYLFIATLITIYYQLIGKS